MEMLFSRLQPITTSIFMYAYALFFNKNMSTGVNNARNAKKLLHINLKHHLTSCTVIIFLYFLYQLSIRIPTSIVH